MEAFRREVVSSVALSCLLAMDFAPNSKPPPVAEMVAVELPRVLAVVCVHQNLGPVIEAELRGYHASNPADLLDRVCLAIKDIPLARKDVRERGHDDVVLTTLSYRRKPPTATCERIKRLTEDVARILEVHIPDGFDDRVGETYDMIHGTIIKV